LDSGRDKIQNLKKHVLGGWIIVPFDVIIMGAGQIASGYDTPDTDVVLTHAHAVKNNTDFNLLGFYDIDEEKAIVAAKKWNADAFKYPVKADIYAICTPDSSHLQSIQQIIKLNPKLIILEKPIADTLSNAELILTITKDVSTQVNFSRRFIYEFQALKENISKFGEFLSGTGLYGKGFINNGSHMIDLLSFFLGEIESVDNISEITDFSERDKTITSIYKFKHGGEFFLRGLDCRKYSVFEIELCFEKARVKILNGGGIIQIEMPKQSEKYSGYKILTMTEEIHTEIDNAMKNMYINVYEHLTEKKKLLSPIQDSFMRWNYIV